MGWTGRTFTILASCFALFTGCASHNYERKVKSVKQADSNVFSVTVDYSKSIAEMVAAGRYYWVFPDITEENFPKKQSSGKVEINLELIHLNKDAASTDEALRELDARGLRPAILEELLAFGAVYPEMYSCWQMVVALGSCFKVTSILLSDEGSLRVIVNDKCPGLGYYGFTTKRSVHVYSPGSWHDRYYFLAVRKPH